MRALDLFLAHPHIARIEGQIVAGGPGTKDDHAATFHHKAGHREGLFARMLEYDIDVALAGDVPDRLAEAARLLDPGVVFGRADFRHHAPALEVFAVDHAFGAKVEHILFLRLI